MAMRKISLQESRDMSLKLEELLAEEAKIMQRKSAMAKENAVELNRCIEEQDKIREIIRTGEMSDEEMEQEEMFDDDGINMKATLTLASIRSGMPICEIPLMDLLNLKIDGEVKANIRSKVNNALHTARLEAMGFGKVTLTIGNGKEEVTTGGTSPAAYETPKEILDSMNNADADDARATQDAINDEYSSEVLGDEILAINEDGTERRIPTLDEILANSSDEIDETIQEPEEVEA